MRWVAIVLPKAAVAQLYGAQQFATVATTNDLASAFTPVERQLVARQVLARCDALDGLADGVVQDTVACQKAFDLQRDVPALRAAAADGVVVVSAGVDGGGGVDDGEAMGITLANRLLAAGADKILAEVYQTAEE